MNRRPSNHSPPSAVCVRSFPVMRTSFGSSTRSAIAVAMVIACLVACDQNAPTRYPTKPEDEAAWTNAPLLELETNEVFSTFDREIRNLSDGSDMWTFAVCRNGGVTCHSFGAGGAAATQCSGANVKCCHHQFIDRDKVVVSYHARGPRFECRSDCKMRPASQAAACN